MRSPISEKRRYEFEKRRCADVGGGGTFGWSIEDGICAALLIPGNALMSRVTARNGEGRASWPHVE